jgi:ribonuclease HI
MSHVILHTDGGARGNPGPAAIGVVVELENGGVRELVAEVAETIGVATNNVAEYRALIRGLEEARRLEAAEVDCFLDSQLVVEQMNGRFKVKHGNVVPLHRQATELRASFKRVSFGYVPRAQNAGADALVNAALDGRPTGSGGVADSPSAGVADTAADAPRAAAAAPIENDPRDLRQAAWDLVREGYYAAANMAGSDLGALNSTRPPGMRYASETQLIREFLQMAGAVSTFAVRLGLVSPTELTEFLQEFHADQPDLIDPADEAWIQQKFDLPDRGARSSIPPGESER